MKRRYVETTVIKPSDWHRDGDEYRFDSPDEERFTLLAWKGSKPNSAYIAGYSVTETGSDEPYYDAVHNGVYPTYYGSDMVEVEDLLDEQGRPCRDIVLCDDFLDAMDKFAERDEGAFGMAMTMAKEWEAAGGIEWENLEDEIDAWLDRNPDQDDPEIRPVSIEHFLCEGVPFDFFKAA